MNSDNIPARSSSENFVNNPIAFARGANVPARISGRPDPAVGRHGLQLRALPKSGRVNSSRTPSRYVPHVGAKQTLRTLAAGI